MATPAHRSHTIAATVFVALAVLLTWPLALHLPTHLPGDGPFDNVTFLWTFWWMREVLAGTSGPLFETTAIFYPFGTGLAMNTHAFSSAFIGAMVLPGLSIVSAQNVVIIASVALNGFCAYLLAWRLTHQTSGALLGGLYFASAPYFAGHLLGHFNLVPAWMLPLFALLWLRTLDTASLAAAIGSGAVVGLTLWTDYYYAAYLLAFMAVTMAVRWLHLTWGTTPRRTSRWPDHLLLAGAGLLLIVVVTIRVTGGGVFSVAGLRVSATTGLPPLTLMWGLLLVWGWRKWRPVPRMTLADRATPFSDLSLAAVAGLTTVAAAFPILQQAARLWQSDDYVAPPGFLRSAAAGIDPVSLSTGNPFHPIWGDLVMRVYDAASANAIESTAWLGLVGIGIVWALVCAHGNDEAMRGRTRLWCVTALVFFVWSLGPYLRVFGENTGLYLPAALLRLLPIVNNLRIPGRAIVMVYLSLGMLLAIAVAFMPWFQKKWRTAAVAAVVLVDFAALPLPLTPLPSPAIYEQLAAMPAGGVLELPIGIRDGYGAHGALDHRALFHQSIHGKPIVGGFVARMSTALEQRYLESPLFGPLLTLSANESLPAAVAAGLRRDGSRLLKENAVRYVVLARYTPTALRENVEAWSLRRVAEDAEREVFEVR
jgi:hypothetical protein